MRFAENACSILFFAFLAYSLCALCGKKIVSRSAKDGFKD
jgi:hypothetical protein